MSDSSPSIRILHVDDEESFLEVTKNYLEDIIKKNYSFIVTSVKSPLEVFEKVKTENFDIILSDYLMPELDGLALFQKLRENQLLSNIPFIIFTGKGREELVIKALNIGIEHYIKKGQDIESQFEELSHAIINAFQYRQTELALEKSQMKSNAIFDAIPDLFFSMDREGTILSYKGDLNEFIVPPEKFFMKPVKEFLPKELAETFVKNIRRTLTTNNLQLFEYEIPIQGEIRFREARMVKSGENEVVTIITDLTARKKYEQALIESERSYREILDASPHPIFILNQKLQILLYNKALLTWNKNFEDNIEVIGQKIDVLCPYLSKQSINEYDAIFKFEKPSFTEEAVSINNEQKYIEIIKIPLKTNLTEKRVVTYFNDVTKRKNVEIRLQESEFRYKNLFNESPISLREEDYTEVFDILDKLSEIGVKDFDEYFLNHLDELERCVELTQILDINMADQNLFGHKSKEAILGSLKKNFVLDTLDIYKKGIISLYKHGFYDANTLIETKDGEIKHVKLKISLISSNHQTQKKIALTSLIDITETVLIEQKLVKSFQEYQFLFENSPAALWIEDYSEVKNYFGRLKEGGVNNFQEYFKDYPEEICHCAELIQVLDVNQATLKLFEKDSKKELTGKLSKIISEGSLESFTNELVSIANGNNSFNYANIKFYSGDKTKYFTLKLSVPDDYKNTLEKVIVSIMDVTELYNTQGELMKQRTELSEFAHFMSHDLNNALNVISGFVELLKEENDQLYLERISKKVNDMSEILNKALSLADAGLVVEINENVNINKIIKSILDNLLPNEISYHIDSIPPVKGDPERIYQIFTNIIENAVNHGDPTYISVNHRINKVMSERVIEIQNNGEMIPEIIIKRIFDQGFSSKKSSGLGLAIVRKLVEAHGWQIDVNSNEEETIFFIRIPIL